MSHSMVSSTVLPELQFGLRGRLGLALELGFLRVLVFVSLGIQVGPIYVFSSLPFQADFYTVFLNLYVNQFFTAP